MVDSARKRPLCWLLLFASIFLGSAFGTLSRPVSAADWMCLQETGNPPECVCWGCMQSTRKCFCSISCEDRDACVKPPEEQ